MGRVVFVRRGRGRLGAIVVWFVRKGNDVEGEGARGRGSEGEDGEGGKMGRRDYEVVAEK